MRRLKRELFWAGLALVLGSILVLSGRSVPEVVAREKQGGELFKELKIFTDVLSIIQRDYVREVDSKELVEGAIKGMLSTLDPHSGYLDPDFYNDLKVETSGEFGGLGIEITIQDGLLTVVSPMEGSPAQDAGVEPGDKIIKIEGKFTKDITLVDAVKRLRGKKGTPIMISVAREGEAELIDIKIIRDKIQVRSIRSRYLEDGFGYVRVSQFMEKTAEDLKKAIRRLSGESPNKLLRGLVLDLRNNPGGLLTQAVAVGDLFLKEGVVVYTDGRVKSQKQKFYAHEAGTEREYPIIVLVNGGSASASEIVAGALKDHGRGLVLGTQTFGKGSVQTILPLDNRGALRLTTALYYTKSGNSIQATGVTPDIVMDVKPEEIEGDGPETATIMREKDLPGSIKNPSKKEKNRKEGKVSRLPDKKRLETVELKELLAQDPQLERALELLKTFNIFGSGRTLTEAVASASSAQ